MSAITLRLIDGKLHVRILFQEDSIPDHYRMQILDSCQNSRLNRYGKGSKEGIELDWPIPKSIREDHFGIWQIKVESDTGTFSQIFHVELIERTVTSMLAGTRMLALPESSLSVPTEVGEKLLTTSREVAIASPSNEKEPVPSIIDISQVFYDSQLPVIEVKGIGKTFAERLEQYEIHTVLEFYNYPDRTYLGEIMRISDSKLSRMLDNAKIVLNQQVSVTRSQEVPEKSASKTSDLLDLPGIGPKTVRKLEELGISAIADLLVFEDRETLRKTLRMSQPRFERFLTSHEKPLVPASILTTRTIDPLTQPVIKIKGIGAKTAEKLTRVGILTVNNLLESVYTDLKGVTSESTFKKWKDYADKLANQPLGNKGLAIKASKDHDITSIAGIGIKTAERLEKAGVKSITDFIGVDIENIALKTGYSQKRLTNWQIQAKKLSK
ncbi:MAG: helix-hairpin-helix domain-containing protein [Candidatus Hodarchaeales archaeon]|jgi:nucleotidyltransferase/DNA polymerase involved in DNA repair